MGKVWAIHTQTKKPKNQKTKKPKNQKNKKTKNKKKQKKQDCTPQGEGVRCRVLGLVFFLFFWFLGFLFFWFFGLCVDSHCRCAKQRLPGTVSGCTRSKVDTLQYSNACYDIVHSANEQQRGMVFNFVRLRHMLLDLCTGNAAICALPWWPVLEIFELDNVKNETSLRDVLFFKVDNIKNEAILRDFLQKWKVACSADGLVPTRFAIFPVHLSKLLRLPGKNDARSYEVLHLSRKIISANLKV